MNLDARVDKLVELNVIEQVANLVNTTVLQDAWDRGQKLNVHACVYGLNDGLLRYMFGFTTGPAYCSALHVVFCVLRHFQPD